MVAASAAAVAGEGVGVAAAAGRSCAYVKYSEDRVRQYTKPRDNAEEIVTVPGK